MEFKPAVADRFDQFRVELRVPAEVESVRVDRAGQPDQFFGGRRGAAGGAVGAEPAVHPIRGGTDGARLSFMGLPCPNLGTGGYAFHGPYEHITVEGMDTETAILLELVRLYADRAGDAD